MRMVKDVPPDLRRPGEGIGRAAATRGVPHQHAAPDEVIDVAERGVLRAFRELGPFGRIELAVEAIQKPVDDEALPVVER